MIAVAATGYDNIDLAACAAGGVTVSNIRNYAVNTVPEHTFALIFALRRSIVAYRQSVAAGDWQRSGQFCYFDYPINDLAGATLGIVGDGALGQSVAAIGRSLGMRVLFYDHLPKLPMGNNTAASSLAEVLHGADFVSLHVPVAAATAT
jgi:glycerate dehydrogenase